MSKTYWTEADLKILAEYYPTGGSNAVQRHLSTPRTHPAITSMARRLGICIDGRTPYKRVPTNEHIDAAIRKAYESGTYGAIKKCAGKINRPYGWVKYRAACMGLRKSVRKEPDWSAEEDEMLQEMAGKSLQWISNRLRMRGYQRSLQAIQSRIYKLELDTSDPDTHTASDLARLLGYIATHPVLRWIEKGWLPAKKHAHMTITDNPQNWRIKRRDIWVFIRDNPHLIDLRRVDRYWFIDLLTQPNIKSARVAA